ncbi:MAG: hypothetical protein ACTSQJ_08905 [Promethearchaeota archaeon]
MVADPTNEVFIAGYTDSYGAGQYDIVLIKYTYIPPAPPGPFVLSTTADTPDIDGDFFLNWTQSSQAKNYTIYTYTSYITKINGSVTELASGLTNQSYHISGLSGGTYYYIVVAFNNLGNSSTTCIKVEVLLPQKPGVFTLSTDANSPDEWGVFYLNWTVSLYADNYSVYVYNSFITEINGSVILLDRGIIDLYYLVTELNNGTFYYIIVAFNEIGNTSSNCIKVDTAIPPHKFVPEQDVHNAWYWSIDIGDWLIYEGEITITNLTDGRAFSLRLQNIFNITAIANISCLIPGVGSMLFSQINYSLIYYNLTTLKYETIWVNKPCAQFIYNTTTSQHEHYYRDIDPLYYFAYILPINSTRGVQVNKIGNIINNTYYKAFSPIFSIPRWNNIIYNKNANEIYYENTIGGYFINTSYVDSGILNSVSSYYTFNMGGHTYLLNANFHRVFEDNMTDEVDWGAKKGDTFYFTQSYSGSFDNVKVVITGFSNYQTIVQGAYGNQIQIFRNINGNLSIWNSTTQQYDLKYINMPLARANNFYPFVPFSSPYMQLWMPDGISGFDIAWFYNNDTVWYIGMDKVFVTNNSYYHTNSTSGEYVSLAWNYKSVPLCKYYIQNFSVIEFYIVQTNITNVFNSANFRLYSEFVRNYIVYLNFSSPGQNVRVFYSISPWNFISNDLFSYRINNMSLYMDIFVNNSLAIIPGSINITIFYNGTYLSTLGYNETYLRPFIYNKTTSQWIPLPFSQFDVDIINDVVRINLDHFSIYAMGYFDEYPPGNFSLTSDANSPDRDGDFFLNWTSSILADNYTIYVYNSLITKINGSVNVLISGLTNRSYHIKGQTNGTYYYKIVSFNLYGNGSSNCIKVIVAIGPPGAFVLSSNAGIPDTDGNFTIFWTDPGDWDNFSIYIHNSLITVINGSVTEMQSGLVGLNFNVSATSAVYYFVIVAYNEFGNSSSNCIRIDVEIPPQPFVLWDTADNPDTDGDFLLNWTLSQYADNYSVYWYTSRITIINGSLNLLSSEIAGGPVIINGWHPSGHFYFIVVAHNIYANTTSNNVHIYVKLPPGPFTLTTNATNPDMNGIFNLIWTNSNGADNYSIYMYNSYITVINGSLTILADQTAISPYLITLSRSGKFYFIAVAFNETGNTSSNCIFVRVKLPPVAPILTSTADDPDTDGDFNLIWTTSPYTDNYSIYFYNSRITQINGSLTLANNNATSPYWIYGLKSQDIYFIIVAYNETGNTTSNCLKIRVRIPPKSPILSSTASDPDIDGDFQLIWTISIYTDNYSLYMYNRRITVINGSLTILNYQNAISPRSISNYKSGDYYFIVVAYNKTGNSTSNCIKIRVRIPPGPFTLSSNAGIPETDGTFNLTWTISAGADNYSVYVYNSEINSSTISEASLIIQGLTNNSIELWRWAGIHYFAILAYNKTGITLSNNISIDIRIPPTSFALSTDADDPDDDGKFYLIWQLSLGANNYSVYRYDSYIYNINSSLTLISKQIAISPLLIEDLEDGSYYFVIVAYNNFGNATSNCLKITVELAEEKEEKKSEKEEGFDLIGFIMSPIGMVLIFGSVAAVIAFVYIRKRYYKASKKERTRIESLWDSEQK